MDKHYEWARDKMSMGAERRSAVIDDTQKLATAYHEGGHALAALYTKGAMPLYKVTCMPRGHALGVTTQAPVDDQTSVTFTEYIATMDVAMGGRAAEELSKSIRDRFSNLLIEIPAVYGKENITSGASSDLENATYTARTMIRVCPSEVYSIVV
jgi:ATP-dependent metalloprotease